MLDVTLIFQFINTVIWVAIVGAVILIIRKLINIPNRINSNEKSIKKIELEMEELKNQLK